MATSAWAEWTFIAESSSDDSKYYLDFSNFESDGNFVYAWTLVDLVERNSDGDLSQSLLYKVDCNIPKKYKFISFITYRGSMAKGGVNLSTQKPDEFWSYPPPNSVTEMLVASICSSNSD